MDSFFAFLWTLIVAFDGEEPLDWKRGGRGPP